MSLDLSSLKKSIISLENSLSVYKEKLISKSNDNEIEVIKAGVIQNFEITYELCWKFIKKWLKLNYDTNIEGITRRELFRKAYENNLIESIDIWMEYHYARNETSHIYNHSISEEVLKISSKFLNDAKKLLKTLENKND